MTLRSRKNQKALAIIRHTTIEKSNLERNNQTYKTTQVIQLNLNLMFNIVADNIFKISEYFYITKKIVSCFMYDSLQQKMLNSLCRLII